MFHICHYTCVHKNEFPDSFPDSSLDLESRSKPRKLCARKKGLPEVLPYSSSTLESWNMQWRWCEHTLVWSYWPLSYMVGMARGISLDTCAQARTKFPDSFPCIWTWLTKYRILTEKERQTGYSIYYLLISNSNYAQSFEQVRKTQSRCLF